MSDALPENWRATTVLDDLEAAADRWRKAELHMMDLVELAAGQGKSWVEIGRALGMSGNGARQRRNRRLRRQTPI